MPMPIHYFLCTTSSLLCFDGSSCSLSQCFRMCLGTVIIIINILAINLSPPSSSSSSHHLHHRHPCHPHCFPHRVCLVFFCPFENGLFLHHSKWRRVCQFLALTSLFQTRRVFHFSVGRVFLCFCFAFELSLSTLLPPNVSVFHVCLFFSLPPCPSFFTPRQSMIGQYVIFFFLPCTLLSSFNFITLFLLRFQFTSLSFVPVHFFLFFFRFLDFEIFVSNFMISLIASHSFFLSHSSSLFVSSFTIIYFLEEHSPLAVISSRFSSTSQRVIYYLLLFRHFTVSTPSWSLYLLSTCNPVITCALSMVHLGETAFIA